MASVFRQDTGEFRGYMAEPEGPLAGGITYWPFKAWLHSDGKLRSDPEPDSTVTDRVATEPAGTVDIPVQNNESEDVHLIVPPDLVDFIVTHRGFRAAALPPETA